MLVDFTILEMVVVLVAIIGDNKIVSFTSQSYTTIIHVIYCVIR